MSSLRGRFGLASNWATQILKFKAVFPAIRRLLQVGTFVAKTKTIPIYHITHLDNLASIIAEGRLWSDSKRIERQLETTSIGHEHIKQRRLRRPVPVAANGFLGEYVPFNFCPRSVMLYVIYKGGVAQYNGGQNPIVHLVSSIEAIEETSRPWAFTERHAELGYAEYFDSRKNLDAVDWKVMPLRYWSGDDETKEKRQAEFLVHKWCPWSAVQKIAVKTELTKRKVEELLADEDEVPDVILEPSWYY